MTEPTSDTQATPKNPSTVADDAVARFEARMAEDKDHEERNRPKRDGPQTIEAAVTYLDKQLAAEMERLTRGGFHMAAQEQAQRETVQDLAWLIEDLGKLHPDS